jgi:hypothetical protein
MCLYLGPLDCDRETLLLYADLYTKHSNMRTSWCKVLVLLCSRRKQCVASGLRRLG